MRRPAAWLAALPVALVLAACADTGQGKPSAATRTMQPPWVAAANPFVVPGWKSGDQASWQQQMTQRALSQNEYLRTN